MTRTFAVETLNDLPNDRFRDILPQLIQSLKNEYFHYSPLSCLIMKKAFSDLRIAHVVYWQLKCEIRDESEYSERFQVLLEALMMGCGKQMKKEIFKQDQIIDALTAIASTLQKAKPTERSAVFKAHIVTVPQKFESYVLPLEPARQLSGLVVDKCFYFESKTVVDK